MIHILVFLAISGVLNAGITIATQPVPSAEFLATTKERTSIVVLEGTPRFSAVPKAADLHKEHIPTILIEQEVFYRRSLEISDSDLSEIGALFSKPGFAVEWRGFKFCGGFHADFAIEWLKDKESLATALVCFSCNEFKLILGGKVIRTDIGKECSEALRKILPKYRRHSPAATPAPQSKKSSVIVPEIPKPNVLPLLPLPRPDAVP